MFGIKSKRSKYLNKAFRHGKREHKYGRIIKYPILVGLIYNIYFKNYFNIICFGLTFIYWAIYLGSHTLEKKCFKKAGGGPRGRTKK